VESCPDYCYSPQFQLELMISARKSCPVRDYTTVSATLAWRWLQQQHSNNGYEGDIVNIYI
jgi:hypothetical protein